MLDKSLNKSKSKAGSLSQELDAMRAQFAAKTKENTEKIQDQKETIDRQLKLIDSLENKFLDTDERLKSEIETRMEEKSDAKEEKQRLEDKIAQMN